jgi:hypothetical protein
MNVPSDLNTAVFWLEIRLEGVLHGFALPPDGTPAIVVGSLPGANLQVARPGVAALHFHIEREGSILWVVPAYGAGDLRVNAMRIASPHPLPIRALIEFSDVRLETFYTAAAPHAHEVCADTAIRRDVEFSEATTVSVLAFADGLAAQPGSRRSSCDSAETVTIGSGSFAANIRYANAARARSQSLTPIFKPALADTQRVIRFERPRVLPPIQNTRHNGSHTQQLIRVSEHEVRPIVDASAKAEAGEERPNQNTTVFDMPGVRYNPSSPRSGWLSRLGVFTRVRPWQTWGLGIGVFLLSGLVGLTHRHWTRASQGSRLPHSSARPLPSLMIKLRESTDASPESRGVAQLRHAQSLPLASAGSAHERAVPTDPDLASGVHHIIAGHYADARVTYAAVARRANSSPALVTISRLLDKKLLPRCANANSNAQLSCPDITP